MEISRTEDEENHATYPMVVIMKPRDWIGIKKNEHKPVNLWDIFRKKKLPKKLKEFYINNGTAIIYINCKANGIGSSDVESGNIFGDILYGKVVDMYTNGKHKYRWIEFDP